MGKVTGGTDAGICIWIRSLVLGVQVEMLRTSWMYPSGVGWGGLGLEVEVESPGV